MANIQKTEVVTTMNNSQAVDKLKELRTEAVKYCDEMIKAKTAGDTISYNNMLKQLNQVNNEIRLMQRNAVNVNDVMSRLSTAKPREIQKAIKAINTELNSGRIERGSKEWDEYTSKLKKCKAELQSVNNELKTSGNGGNFFTKVADGFNRYSAAAAGAIASLTGIAYTAKKCVDNFAEMDEAMTEVMKYTNMTKDQVKDLNVDLKKMDTRTSREQLNALAGDAGRLGITAKQGVEEFVDAADKINVALGEDLGPDAVKNIGRMAMMFGEDKTKGLRGAMLATGSAVNELSQEVGADANYLVGFTARLAGVAKQANMSQADVLGFAGVLNKNMIEEEVAGSALEQLLLKLYQQPQKFAKIAGLDVKNFTALLKTDANKALVTFFESLKKFGNLNNLAPAFKDMGLDGVRASGVLSTLANKISDVSKQQLITNKAYKEGTSVITEFNTENNTVQAGFDKAVKRIKDKSIDLGETLQPLMTNMLHTTSASISILNTVVTFTIKHSVAIGTLVASIGVYIALSKASNLLTAGSNTLHKLAATFKVLHAVATATLSGNIANANKIQDLFSKSIIANNTVVKVCTSLTYLHAAAVALFHGRIREAKAAMIAFNASLAINPIVAATVAIAALIYVCVKLCTSWNAATIGAKKLNDEMKVMNKGYDDRIAVIRKYLPIAQDANAKLEDRKHAIENLKKVYPDYFKNMDIENAKTISLVDAEKELNKQKDIKIRIMAIEAKREYDQRKKDLKDVQDIMKNDWGKTQNNAADAATLSRLHYKVDEAKSYLDSANKAVDDVNKRIKQIAKDDKKKPEEKTNPPETKTYTTQTKTKKKKGKSAETLEHEREKKAIDQIEAKYDKLKAVQISYYASGQIDKQKFDDQINELDLEMLDKKMGVYKTDSKEYNALLLEKANKKKEIEDKAHAKSVEDVDQDAKKTRDSNLQMLIEKKTDQKTFEEDIHQLEYDTLQKKRDVYAKGSKEYEDYQKQMDEWSYQDKLEKQKSYEEKVKEIKEESTKKSNTEIENETISFLEKLHKEGIGSEEEYQKIIAAIRRKYAVKKGEEEVGYGKNASKVDEKATDIYDIAKSRTGNQDHPETDNIFDTMFGNDAKLHTGVIKNLKQMEKSDEISHSQYLAAKSQADEEYYKTLEQKASMAYNQIGGLMSSYSDYVSACSDAEVAKVTKRYDKEIKTAGESTTKGKKLEEQKEKDIAKIKSKYNKRKTRIQIAQALAETAISALNAYNAGWEAGWPAGQVLAPLFAGIAVASGMLQVATIKKQAAAQDEGYYSGGFTDGNNYHKVAGSVHEGEFVANHQAVNNPNVLPVLQLIDRAQRNNTIGTLTANDVTHAINRGSSADDSSSSADNNAAAGIAVMSASLDKQSAVINRLSSLLETGIQSYVVMDGEQGLDKKYTHYKKLQSNKER